MEKEQKKLHYAWLILAGCCILQGASLGLVSNCAGVFYSPICQDLGFEMGAFTFYKMLASLSSAFAMPFAAKYFREKDVRVVISAAAILFGGSTAAMGIFTELWQWYVGGIVQGFSSAFLCMIPAPILLGNWFHKKTGTAIGIAAVFSGFVGMVGSAVLGYAIPAFGWRASQVGQGLLSVFLILPVSVFVLRYRPEDKNMKAYGAEEEEKTEASGRETAEKKQALRDFLNQPAFYVCLLVYGCSVSGAYLNAFLTGRGLEAGMTISTAAMLTSLALMGNMCSKLFLGRLSDSRGVRPVFQVASLIALLGHILLLTSLPTGLMAGSCLYGITMPLSSVMLPLFCRLFWSGDSYGAAFSYVSMCGTLLASPFNTLYGMFYDRTGSYRFSIGTSAVMILAIFLLVSLFGRKRREAAPSQGR